MCLATDRVAEVLALLTNAQQVSSDHKDPSPHQHVLGNLSLQLTIFAARLCNYQSDTTTTHWRHQTLRWFTATATSCWTAHTKAWPYPRNHGGPIRVVRLDDGTLTEYGKKLEQQRLAKLKSGDESKDEESTQVKTRDE